MVHQTLLTNFHRISLRAATELFSARIDQLTQFIYDNGLEPPQMRPDAEQEMNRVLDTLQVPRSVVKAKNTQNSTNLPRATPQNRDISREHNRSYTSPANRFPAETAGTSILPSLQFPNINNHDYIPPVFDFSLPTAEILDDLYAHNLRTPPNNTHLEHTEPFAGVERTSLRAQQHDDDSASETGDEAEREVIEQLSSRMGTLKLAGDGHLRFYGPTSNLNLVDVTITSKQRPGPDVRSVRHDGQELLNHLRIGQHVEPSLESHLIDLYFTWQNPSLYIVDREMFTLARAKWRDELDDTPFYSEVLTNAMYVILSDKCHGIFLYTDLHAVGALSEQHSRHDIIQHLSLFQNHYQSSLPIEQKLSWKLNWIVLAWLQCRLLPS